jgi:ComF family protein
VPADIDHCIAALAYDYPVDRLVTGLKYQRKLLFARVLGELLAIRIKEALVYGELEIPELIMPVPMHRWRLARRTYNQAEEIARWLQRDLRVPVESSQLLRVRNTPRQTSLSRAVRLRNIHGAFHVRGNVADKRIALVDDVITTAATVRELAQILKRAGAAEVQVWAVARTDS